MRFITKMDAVRSVGEMDMDATEYVAKHKKSANREGYMVNEVLKGNPIVRLYFDYDHKLDDTKPTEEQKQFEFKVFQELVQKICPDAEIAYAQRHGFKVQKRQGKVTYKGWVISYRAYVKGFMMHVGDIPLYIKANLGKNKPDELDDKVYKVNGNGQLLGVIGAHKSPYDKRFLTPITHQDDPLAFVC